MLTDAREGALYNNFRTLILCVQQPTHKYLWWMGVCVCEHNTNYMSHTARNITRASRSS